MNKSSSPIVSAVVTVYNKASFLPATIRSLRDQMPDEEQVEYVFVDDASTDRSISVIEEALQGAPHVRIIANDTNTGPSVRLNQGAKAATGTYLYFLDGDDLAAEGAMTSMLDLLKKEQADLIYGKTRKLPASSREATSIKADPTAPHTVSETPLAYIMKGGFVRMALMCKRSLFLEAGGADERIFVQDESLPLRLAALSKRFIDWQATVTVMPSPGGEGSRPGDRVSNDKTQLHHDAFFAYANALAATARTHPDVAPKLYAKAISAYWKYGKRQSRAGLLHPGFWRYLQAKCLRPSPNPKVLDWMADELRSLPNVRRPKTENA
ncbi:MAG: glycosyltransferase family 2 protein [Geminicoccaceae bacterium]